MKTARALKQVHEPPETAPCLRVEGLRGRDLARVREDRTQEEPDVPVRHTHSVGEIFWQAR
jgi:hypothetical protein